MNKIFLRQLFKELYDSYDELMFSKPLEIEWPLNNFIDGVMRIENTARKLRQESERQLEQFNFERKARLEKV